MAFLLQLYQTYQKKRYILLIVSVVPEKISKNDQSDKDTRNLLDVLKSEKSHYKLMTIDAVKKNLINNNISNKIMEDKIIFKKDFFPDSFKHFDEKISFLHLDVDLYDSYVECLKFLQK